MRALNRPEVISVLQSEFINCWLLAKDLDEIATESKDPEIEKLCHLTKQNYKYPVDSVLISNDLTVIGHVNVNQTEVLMPNGYLSFLKKGLAEIGIQIETVEQPAAEMTQDSAGNADVASKPPAGLKLTREQPEGSLLEIVRNNGSAPRMVVYPIDVSDFPDGGTVEITIRLGSGNATAQFELSASDAQNPEFFMTLKTIPEIAAGETETMTQKFEQDQNLMLVVKAQAGPNDQSQSSAFLATVTVKESD